jgi:hypothetical protein
MKEYSSPMESTSYAMVLAQHAATTFLIKVILIKCKMILLSLIKPTIAKKTRDKKTQTPLILWIISFA